MKVLVIDLIVRNVLKKKKMSRDMKVLVVDLTVRNVLKKIIKDE